MKRISQLVLSSLLLLSPFAARANVALPHVFADNMVLQREMPVPVWGTAAPGEAVSVTFAGQTKDTKAGDDGTWRVTLDPLKMSATPAEMTVVGSNTVKLENVVVGDVWICSGQSNMEYGASRDQAAQANDPQIRLFHVPETVALAPRKDVQATWQVCSPAALFRFTAVGFAFAKDLRPVLNCPIGLIASSFGGTTAQAWTDLPTLQSDPALRHYANDYGAALAKYPGGDPEYVTKKAAYDAAAQQLLEASKTDPKYQAAENQWKQAAAQAKAAGQPTPPEPRVPQPPGLGVSKVTPTSLFDGMIAPLIPYAIKGVIWYQGENNTHNTADAAEYATLFPAMITDWRSLWKQGDFPFLYVQLANFTAGPGADWPRLRESQLKTLSLPKTGMAVIIDIGTGGNIHPPDKTDVGLRLALAARHVAYGESLVYTGPLYASMTTDGNKIRVSFQPDSVGGGLTIGVAPWHDPQAAPVSTTELQGFTVAGADRMWVPAQATISGNTVVVSSPLVPNPVAVRYAWADDPICNLYNKEGLPASPFRTDTWEPSPPAAAAH